MDKPGGLDVKVQVERQCLRANIARLEDIEVYGTVKVAKIYSNILNKRDQEPELYDDIMEVAPEWWGADTQKTLNKDLVCKRHRDHAKKEHSWIFWLGDFTGGALNFDHGAKIVGKREWHKINGHIHHWSDPHEGNKYSIVLYRRTRNPKSNKLAGAKKAKRESLPEGSPTEGRELQP